MPPNFLLWAHDHPSTKSGRALLEEALGDALGTKLVSCTIGAAHGDDPGRNKAMAKTLERILGGPCAAPSLTDPGLDAKAARKAIEAADVIYFDGGDTLEIMRGAERHGLVDAFQRAAKRVKLLAGLSAGACVMSACTIGWDDEGQVPHVAPCLDMGLAWPIDVHSEEDDWPEVRELLELLREQGKQDAAVLAIPSHGAVIVDGKGGVTDHGKAAAELRRLGKKGEWVVTYPGKRRDQEQRT